MANGDFAAARGELTRTLSSHPGEDDLAQIQWLIARTYEMEGRWEEAVSEYRRFLRDYPDHRNARDAEEKIRQLEENRTAKSPKGKKSVRVNGNLSTDYEYAFQTTPDALTTLSRPSERLDVYVRNLGNGRGKVVVSGLKTFDLLDNSRDQTRIYKLYTQWRNVPDTMSFQLGRQSGSSGGLWSRFDGLQLAYNPTRNFGYDLAGGFPVDFYDTEGIGTDHYFYEAGVHLLDLRQTVSRFYFVRQYEEGYLEREALGGNLQATWGAVSLTGNLDYDLGFGEFNDRFISLDYQVKEPVHLTAALDVRKDPYLRLTTALQDPLAVEQGVVSLRDWIALQGEAAVRESAQSLTIDTRDIRLGSRWDINPVWSTSLDYSHEISDVIQPDGTRGDRTSDRYSLYLSEQNHWGFSEILSILLIHQTGSDLNIESLYLTAARRFGSWMTLQMKGRVEDARFTTLQGADYVRYVPGMAMTLDFTPRWSFNVEAEYAMEDHDSGDAFSSVWSRFNMTSVF
ncbi:MAG: tetratricopeptide repeat protein [Nitrospirae bacterium]|nr:tetratricopeptide repeat protein [Nitrospirota bacterium]